MPISVTSEAVKP